MLLYDRDDSFIYLVGLDANRTSKYLAMALRVITTVVTSPMVYAIVRFETNCHNRTLVNWLIGFEFIVIIIWNFTVSFTTMFRYLSGPFLVLLCQLQYLNKNEITLIFAVQVDLALIIRYIFVFKSENPTVVQDEFQILFRGIWTVGFSLTCHQQHSYFLERSPQHFTFV